MIDKKKLNKLFRLFRKQGFVAKQNYMCCGSCASAQIAADLKDWDQAKKDACLGAIFYTRQDAKRSDLYLSYGPIEISSEDIARQAIAGPAWSIGHIIINALREVGLTHKWNGDAGVRILILGNETQGKAGL
jgi:hypothetical protein